jgi:hypothetical protein
MAEKSDNKKDAKPQSYRDKMREKIKKSKGTVGKKRRAAKKKK